MLCTEQRGKLQSGKMDVRYSSARTCFLLDVSLEKRQDVGFERSKRIRRARLGKVRLLQGPKPVPLSAYPARKGLCLFVHHLSLPNGSEKIFVEICSYVFSESRLTCQVSASRQIGHRWCISANITARRCRSAGTYKDSCRRVTSTFKALPHCARGPARNRPPYCL